MKLKNQKINLSAMLLKAQAISLCLFLFMFANLNADDMILNNGNVLKGIVGEQTEDFVEFHSPTGSIKLPRTKIKKILPGTEEQNEFYRLDIALRKRRLDDALRSLRNYQLKQYDASKLPKIIAKRELELGRMLHSASMMQRALCLNILADFSSGEDILPEYCFMLGKLFQRNNYFEQASVQYLRSAMNSANDSDFKKKAIEYFRKRIIVSGRKGIKAGECLELMALDKLTTETANKLGAWLSIREAAGYRKKGKLVLALKIFEAPFEKNYPQIAKNRNWYSVQSISRQLLAENKDAQVLKISEEFLSALEHPDARQLMSDIFLQLGEKKLSSNKFDAAEELFMKAEQAKAGSALTNLERLKVKSDQSKLTEQDFEAKIKFAKDCIGKKQFDISRELAGELFLQDGLTTHARSLLRETDEKEAFELFKKASIDFETNHFHRTMDIIEEIKDRFPASQLQLEVSQLERRTARAMSAIPDDPDEEYKLPLTFKEVERAAENIDIYLEENQPRFNKWQLLYKAEIALRDGDVFRKRTDYKNAEIEYLRILNKQSASEAAKKLKPKMDEFYADWVLHELETTMKIPFSFEFVTFENAELKKELDTLIKELDLLK